MWFGLVLVCLFVEVPALASGVDFEGIMTESSLVTVVPGPIAGDLYLVSEGYGRKLASRLINCLKYLFLTTFHQLNSKAVR